MNGKKFNWDALGVTTSVACAIHCAVLPLLLTSLPIFGINIIENIFFEYFMILVAFLIGTYALSHGFFRHHRSLAPLAAFGSGIGFLFAKQIWHSLEWWFLIPGVLLVLAGHFMNYRKCQKATQCDH